MLTWKQEAMIEKILSIALFILFFEGCSNIPKKTPSCKKNKETEIDQTLIVSPFKSGQSPISKKSTKKRKIDQNDFTILKGNLEKFLKIQEKLIFLQKFENLEVLITSNFQQFVVLKSEFVRGV